MKLSNIVESTFFHGTTENALPSILSIGIAPNKGHGADAWAISNGYKDHRITYSDIPERENSIYLSTEDALASIYASRASKINKSAPIVLKIDLPSDVKLKPDEAGGSKAFRYEGIISPEWITGIYQIDYENDALIPLSNSQYHVK